MHIVSCMPDVVKLCPGSAGHALSQTGGHGDFRGKGEEVCCCGSALRGIGRVCDGVGERVAPAAEHSAELSLSP